VVSIPEDVSIIFYVFWIGNECDVRVLHDQMIVFENISDQAY